MADTVVSQQGGGTDLNPNLLTSEIFKTIDTGLVSYFTFQTAKAGLNSNPQNVLIIVGGLAVLGVLAYLVLKH